MTLRGRHAIALMAAVMLAGSCAAAAAAKVVSYKNIVSPSGLISCLVVMHSTEIECSAPYLPDIGELDTYLALRPHGRAIESERGDSPAYASPRRRLRYGDTWKRTGISCTLLAGGLTCRNRDRHGFHISKGHVRRF